MFAVPGWSISGAAPKTQKLAKTDSIASGSAKKRKRSSAKSKEESITSDNLAELWEKHIDGRTTVNAQEPEAKSKLSKREKKRRKYKQDASTLKDANDDSKEEIPEQDGTEKPHIREPPNSEKIESKMKLTAPQKKRDLVEGGRDGTLIFAKAPPLPSSNLTPLQSNMRQKLISSRFRTLNETLYTTSSDSSFELFNQNPRLFTEYHEGFQRQVLSWPENPVDGFIRWIRDRGRAGNLAGGSGNQKAQFRKHKKDKKEKVLKQDTEEQRQANLEGVVPLPRDLRTGMCTIVDLGCGEARLSQILSTTPSPSPSTVSLNLRIHSFDLAATSELVTAADVRSLPLAESSVDIAIFCLALMGTNWIEFVEEAYRVLQWKGECWISEVGSRFGKPKTKPRQVEHSVGKRTKEKDTRHNRGKVMKGNKADGGDELEGLDIAEEVPAVQQASTDVSTFVSVLQRRGFELQGQPELGNKMFVRMRFIKARAPLRGKCVRKGGDSQEGHKKFIERETDEAITVAEEASALKPCVYKTR